MSQRAIQKARTEAALIQLIGRTQNRRPDQRRTSAPIALLLAVLTVTCAVRTGAAQDSGGSDGATVAGAALGLYAGAALGSMSALIPCNQTMAGVSCVRTVTVLGSGIGLVSGLTLGREDADGVWDAYRRAGIGLAGGSLVVLALKPIVNKWSWGDVGAGAVIGSSIAAGGSGAWIGLVAGLGVGVGLWQLIPSVELPDAIGIGLIGMGIGAFSSWIVRAVNSGDDPAADMPVLTFDVPVPW